MAALLSRLTAFIGASLTGLFGSWKLFLAGGFVTALMIGLYGLVVKIITEFLDVLYLQLSQVEQVPGGVNLALNFTGFTGWLLSVMKFPECVAFIVACVAFKFTMKKIPFIKW